MDKNEQAPFGMFKLRIQRPDGVWENSLQSECEAYLEKTATNWLELEMVKAFRIDLVPPINPKGAFGLPRGVLKLEDGVMA